MTARNSTTGLEILKITIAKEKLTKTEEKETHLRCPGPSDCTYDIKLEPKKLITKGIERKEYFVKPMYIEKRLGP